MIKANNNKKSLRKHFRELRRNLTTNDKQQAAINIAQQLIKIPVYQKAQHIGMYSALADEASLNVFSELAREAGKTLYLPVIDKNSSDNLMNFKTWSSDAQLSPNSLGIPEPNDASNSSKLNIVSTPLDLLLLPLVAYDKKGQRLGMGGGFYDRYIQNNLNKQCVLIGVAFSCQQATVLPNDSWDKQLHAVVNEKEFLSFT